MGENTLFDAEIIDGDILAIVLRGNLDTTTTPEFERLVQEHLDHGLSKIIIDCRYMGYVSSLGIGALVSLQNRMKQKGGEVKLAAIQGNVIQVIRAVRLDKILNIYGDLEFARESFYK